MPLSSQTLTLFPALEYITHFRAFAVVQIALYGTQSYVTTLIQQSLNIYDFIAVHLQSLSGVFLTEMQVFPREQIISWKCLINPFKRENRFLISLNLDVSRFCRYFQIPTLAFWLIFIPNSSCGTIIYWDWKNKMSLKGLNFKSIPLFQIWVSL